MVTCNLLWQWRNRSIFEQDFVRPSDACPLIFDYVSNIVKAREFSSFHWHLVCGLAPPDIWFHPPQGWIKINLVGASSGNPGVAGWEGVLRDAKGKWMKGYFYRLG